MDELPAAVLLILRCLMQEAAATVSGSQVALVGLGERGSALERGVLIWLYHATPALNFASTARSDRVESALSVDLSVLLTCVGDERRYEPARLLGGCLAIIESHPLLRAQDAREALAAIEGHDLDRERVLRHWTDLPLMLHPLTLADLSQLWGVGGARGLSVACRVERVPCGAARSSHG